MAETTMGAVWRGDRFEDFEANSDGFGATAGAEGSHELAILEQNGRRFTAEGCEG
jgi:hypothetical protein